jgi:hypothetical protein
MISNAPKLDDGKCDRICLNARQFCGGYGVMEYPFAILSIFKFSEINKKQLLINSIIAQNTKNMNDGEEYQKGQKQNCSHMGLNRGPPHF